MSAKHINSTSHAIIKAAVRVREGHSKGNGFEFFIEGPHLLESALRAKQFSLLRVFFTEEFAGGSDGRALLRRTEVFLPQGSTIGVSDAVMAKLSDAKTPQGIAAIVSSPRLGLADLRLSPVPLLVACDRVQNPGNMGTIIRLADAFGAEGVIVLSGSCNPFMPKAVRSSAGSIFHLSVVFTGPEDLAAYAEQRAVTLIGADARAEKDCFSAGLRRPLILVLGNEAHGISPELGAHITESVRVPIIGQAESLNVAASAAVLLYEAMRQRAAQPGPR